MQLHLINFLINLKKYHQLKIIIVKSILFLMGY